MKDHPNPFLCVLGVIRARFLATMLVAILLVVKRRHLKVAALPGSDLVDVHPVELLESAALTLDDEEVDDESSDSQASSEDVSVGKVNCTGDEWGEKTDEEVPEPVGCGGQSHTLGTVLGREQFGADSPDHGTPGHGVGGDEETGDNNHALTRSGSVFGVLNVQHEVANRSEDHEANKHESSTSDERLATTEVLNNVETTESGTEVNSTKNDLGDEAVGDTGTLEDSGTLLNIDVSI